MTGWYPGMDAVEANLILETYQESHHRDSNYPCYFILRRSPWISDVGEPSSVIKVEQGTRERQPSTVNKAHSNSVTMLTVEKRWKLLTY